MKAYRERLHLLISRWSSTYASCLRFDSHITESQKLPKHFDHPMPDSGSSKSRSEPSILSGCSDEPDILPPAAQDDLELDDAAC
jgi:hypothetical protein